MTRTNSSATVIIGALVLVIAGLGFYIYREETKPKGVEISIGQNGVKVQGN